MLWLVKDHFDRGDFCARHCVHCGFAHVAALRSDAGGVPLFNFEDGLSDLRNHLCDRVSRLCASVSVLQSVLARLGFCAITRLAVRRALEVDRIGIAVCTGMRKRNLQTHLVFRLLGRPEL
jgi:hypothetical protein